jgi:hypothetical protein
MPGPSHHDSTASKGHSHWKTRPQYRAVVQIRSKYRGSVTTLVFGNLKPHTGFLKGSRLDLVYYQNPGLNAGDPFPLWTLTEGDESSGGAPL